MNPDQPNLRQQQQQHSQESATLRVQEQSQTTREFNSAEELVRFDAGQIPVPESIAERLKESIAAEPVPPKSWWRRLFGKA